LASLPFSSLSGSGLRTKQKSVATLPGSLQTRLATGVPVPKYAVAEMAQEML
jgi:hypothetical protein